MKNDLYRTAVKFSMKIHALIFLMKLDVKFATKSINCFVSCSRTYFDVKERHINFKFLSLLVSMSTINERQNSFYYTTLSPRAALLLGRGWWELAGGRGRERG